MPTTNSPRRGKNKSARPRSSSTPSTPDVASSQLRSVSDPTLASTLDLGAPPPQQQPPDDDLIVILPADAPNVVAPPHANAGAIIVLEVERENFVVDASMVRAEHFGAPVQDPRGLSVIAEPLADQLFQGIRDLSEQYAEAPDQLAAEIAKSAARSVAGQQQPAPVAPARDIDDYLKVGVGTLAGLAIVLGVASVIRSERQGAAVSGIALGGLAVGFQLFAWTVMMIAGTLILASVIYVLRDTFGDIFGGLSGG